MFQQLLFVLGMKRRIIKSLVFIYVLVGTFTATVSAIDIIVNPSVQKSPMTLNKVRSIFTMRQKYWPSGGKIHVFTLADGHQLHKQFTKNKLSMFPHQLRRVWDRIIFSGTGQTPVVLNSEEEMLERITNTVDSIGYLSCESENEKVRLLITQ